MEEWQKLYALLTRGDAILMTRSELEDNQEEEQVDDANLMMLKQPSASPFLYRRSR